MAGSKPRPATVLYDGSRFATISDGTIIQIDPEDAHLLSLGHWKFSDHRGVYCHPAGGTAKQRPPQVILHRRIMGATDPNKSVFHRNGDRTDCRRANLDPDPYACPFSRGRLDAMYWGQWFPFNRIAEEAAKVNGYPAFSDRIVQMWLKAAQIRIRTRNEISRQVMTRPQVRRAVAASQKRLWEKRRAGMAPMPPQNLRPFDKRVTRMGIRAAARKRRQAREHDAAWPVSACDLCGKQFRRRACYVSRAVRQERHGIYCGKHCANRATWILRKNRELATVASTRPTVERVGETLADFLKRLQEQN